MFADPCLPVDDEMADILFGVGRSDGEVGETGAGVEFELADTFEIRLGKLVYGKVDEWDEIRCERGKQTVIDVNEQFELP